MTEPASQTNKPTLSAKEKGELLAQWASATGDEQTVDNSKAYSQLIKMGYGMLSAVGKGGQPIETLTQQDFVATGMDAAGIRADDFKSRLSRVALEEARKSLSSPAPADSLPNTIKNLDQQAIDAFQPVANLRELMSHTEYAKGGTMHALGVACAVAGVQHCPTEQEVKEKAGPAADALARKLTEQVNQSSNIGITPQMIFSELESFTQAVQANGEDIDAAAQKRFGMPADVLKAVAFSKAMSAAMETMMHPFDIGTPLSGKAEVQAPVARIPGK